MEMGNVKIILSSRASICFYTHNTLLKYVHLVYFTGEQGMVDEAQKALEEAEALKKVYIYFIKFQLASFG